MRQMNHFSRIATAGAASFALLSGCTSSELAPHSSTPVPTSSATPEVRLTSAICEALDNLDADLGRYANIPGGGGRDPWEFFGDENGQTGGEAVLPDYAAKDLQKEIKKSGLDPNAPAVKSVGEVAALARIVDAQVLAYADRAPKGDPMRVKKVIKYFSAEAMRKAGLTPLLELTREKSYIVGIAYCAQEPIDPETVDKEYQHYFPTPAPTPISTPEG